MERLIYVLDTNAIGDIINHVPSVLQHLQAHQNQVLCLCQPVDFETRRGLLWRGAIQKQTDYETLVKPQFQWIEVTQHDWDEAARWWAITRSAGKQLSDVDLLIAAIALRLGAIIVSNDTDFDALPATRHDWRVP